MDKKLLFIVNPRAGKTKSHSAFYDAVSIFCRYGYLVSVHNTEGRGDATRVAKECGEQYDLVVCCGGDGTLNETINGLLQCQNPPPIGYIPAGSTNDFAVSLGLSTDLLTAAENIMKGKQVELDVGRFNGRYFSYVASFGAFTKSSYSAPQEVKNLLGHAAYLLEGIKDISTLHPYAVSVEADGEKYEGNFLFGAISNSTSIAGLLKLPEEKVKMGDGLFELLLVRCPANPLELQNLISALFAQDLDNESIFLRHVMEVKVSSKEKLDWSLDGEHQDGGTSALAECVSHRFRIVM